MTSEPAPLSKEEETKLVDDFLQHGHTYTVVMLKDIQKKLKLPIKGRMVKALLFSKITELLTHQPTNHIPTDPNDHAPLPNLQPTVDRVNLVSEFVEEATARIYGDDKDFDIQLTCGFASISVPKQYHFTSKADFMGNEMGKYMLVHETVKEHQTKDKTKFKFTGECKPQMKSTTSIMRKTHMVRVDINSSRAVIGAYCSCLVGLCGSCKHTKGLIDYVNNERTQSCTTKKKVWGGPKSTDPKGQPVVGGIVEAKEMKCKVLPVDLHPLIQEYLLDLDSPTIELYKLEHNIN